MACTLLLKETSQKLSTSLSKIFHWPEFCYMVTTLAPKETGKCNLDSERSYTPINSGAQCTSENGQWRTSRSLCYVLVERKTQKARNK